MQLPRSGLFAVLQVNVLIGLSGCSSLPQMSFPALPLLNTGAVECSSPSADCAEQRAARLRSLVADRTHAWVRQVEPLESYAAGTRLFAYRMAKTKLRCADLAHGVIELQTAHAAYGKPVSGVPAAQAERTRSLIVKARSELNQETQRRCQPRKGQRASRVS
jgi:hypothetical protein